MLRQFSALFAGTFFISLFVLMMQFLWRYVDELIGKGLSMEVLAEFFWYMGLMLVPQALPLAILLASLITMGNLGESSELTAIKAAGIPLIKCLRSLIFAAIMVAGISFVFQNNIGPKANVQLRQLLLSMKQKSPELEIPEEVFYSGIPNCNLYVQHKDMDTGMLYGVMIYRMTQSFEDAAIILADSGKLQSTAEKQHLVLTLYNGEWFENLRSQELGGNANVPYRRESFLTKVIVLDFDNGFNLAESSGISQMAAAQSLPQLMVHSDSVARTADSIGAETRRVFEKALFFTPEISRQDSLATRKAIAKGTLHLDSVMQRLTPERQRDILRQMHNRIEMAQADLQFRSYVSMDIANTMREYKIEMVNKFTLALTCIIFFFIGASLGAIIRKGGLGIPVIISVLVFIIFYILDNTGFRMARQGSWSIAFGKGLAPMVLVPIAVFVTYKANKDSVVFNMDAYRLFFIKLLGMRQKRQISSKEIILSQPDYEGDVMRLAALSQQMQRYSEEHHLMRLPNPVNVFFRYQPDNDVEQMAEELELIITDLNNTTDSHVIEYLRQYPIIAQKAHTRPFDRPWMNVASAVLLPLGIILYIRMCRFRLRLHRDLKHIRRINDQLTIRITSIT